MSHSKSYRTVNELLENWEPRKSDIEFIQNLIRTVRNGGKWEVPRNGQIYVFDHTNKTLTMTAGIVDFITHRTRVICAKLGWRVLIDVKGPEDDGQITVTECGNTN